MNYLEHFALKDAPFRITPDRNFYFPSRAHTAVQEVIKFGLSQGEGFLIIAGEVGTGKTLLLRLMMGELGKEYETALILSPHLSRKELLLAVLQDIGLEQNVDRNASLDALLRVLNDHLYELAQENRRLLIVIDEAQNLPDDSLEQLRLLSNFETDTQKLLQIVLFGQPELEAKLEQESLRQLLQRVTIKETLTPFTKLEIRKYIKFRFAKGGNKTIKVKKSALNLLWKYTLGYPRLINKIMSRALLVAYAEQDVLITKKAIKEAFNTLNTPQEVKSPSRAGLWWAICSFTLAGALGLSIFLSPAWLEDIFPQKIKIQQFKEQVSHSLRQYIVQPQVPVATGEQLNQPTLLSKEL